MMVIRTAFIFGMIALSACGATAQQTPEPNETEKVNALVEKLGTQLTYNSKTLLMDPEPDGRVLIKWMDRRKATLNGTLHLTQRPALSNPGTVAATLAWEREAEKREGRASNAITLYMLDFEKRKASCARSAASEAGWFDQEKSAHAKGLRANLIDWQSTNKRFQTRCDIEAQQLSGAEESRRVAAKVRDSRMVGEEQKCRQQAEAAQAIYMEKFTVEAGRVAQAASEAMNQCLRDIEERRRIADEADAAAGI